MGIILPKPNVKIAPSILNPRMLLFYAEPKLGKTTLLGTLPDSLIIDLEQGADAAETGARISVKDVAEKQDFVKEAKKKGEAVELAYLRALNEIGGEIIKQGRPYKYIIGDTLTELSEWTLEDGTDRLKHSIIGKNFEGASCLELPKGGGYYWWRLSYGTYYKALASLASECFIGVAHLKDSMLVNKEGKEVEATDLSLTGQLKQITCSKADAIGYLYRKTVGAEKGKPLEEIWVSFRSAGVTAGNRFRRLTYKDIFLSKVVNSAEEPIVGKWDEIFLKEKEDGK